MPCCLINSGIFCFTSSSSSIQAMEALQSSMACIEELEEVKQNMPEFMRQHGMPIKALAWTGEEAPKELSEDGSINIAGYSWDPVTDKMRVTIPKIFHGEK